MLDAANGNAAPIWNIACGIALPWPATRCGDATDAVIAPAVRGRFRGAGELSASERCVVAPHTDGAFPPSRIEVHAEWLLRSDRPPPMLDGRAPALLLAGEIGRTIALARHALPVVKPGYAVRIDLVVSVGGIGSGLHSRPSTAHRPLGDTGPGAATCSDSRSLESQGRRAAGNEWPAERLKCPMCARTCGGRDALEPPRLQRGAMPLADRRSLHATVGLGRLAARARRTSDR